MLETGYDMEQRIPAGFMHICTEADPQIAHPSQRDWHIRKADGATQIMMKG